jgi:zinc protease
MVLCVFGKIDTLRIRELVAKHFAELERGGEMGLARRPPDFPDAIKEATRKMNKEQLAIMVGFPGIAVTDPDRYPIEALTSMLNSQGGKLFHALRDERGLAYSVGAFNILGVEPGAFVLYILTAPDMRDEAIAGMLEVFRDIKDNGVNEQDLERTRVELMGTHAIGLQTNAQLATEVSFDELYGLGYNNYRNYDEKIRGITAADIRRVSAGLLEQDRYVLVTVGGAGAD